jgi:hypothetical protein
MAMAIGVKPDTGAGASSRTSELPVVEQAESAIAAAAHITREADFIGGTSSYCVKSLTGAA